MEFIILRFRDWCCKSKGFRKKSEYDLTKQFLRRLERRLVELSLEKFRHHTRQLTVTNPFFLISRSEESTTNPLAPDCPLSQAAHTLANPFHPALKLFAPAVPANERTTSRIQALQFSPGSIRH